jgi:hypothetical protein
MTWMRKLLVLFVTLVAWPQALAQPQSAPGYLFSYFTGNGEDGLHFAESDDGLTWSSVANGRSFLTPAVGSKLMRDPSIVRGGDGTFHLVWTTGWWDKGIGVAHSQDLVRWSEQQFVPVMEHEPEAQNCWAPEIFFDDERGRYLIYWSTTIPGRSRKPIRRIPRSIAATEPTIASTSPRRKTSERSRRRACSTTAAST